MQTYIVYFSALLSSVGLAYFGQKKNKKKYLIFAALILSLIAGLRANNVGVDTPNYLKLFTYIADGQLDLAYGLETSFKYICAFLLGIWNHPNFLFTVFALITNILIFSRLWDLKEYISIPWAVIVYWGVFYFATLNILRQYIAVAIIFFATKYIVKRNYARFILCVFLASLFHKSALIGIAFIIFDIFAWRRLTPKQKRIIRTFLTIVPIVAIIFGTVIIGRYAAYFENPEWNIGLLLPMKFVIFAFTAILMVGEYRYSSECAEHKEEVYLARTTNIYYALGILVTSIGYMFTFMDRVGLYFYLFETVYIGRVMKSKHVGLFRFAVAALYLMLLLISIFGNGQGQGNYLFIWQ